MTMTFKEALIAHLQGEKVQVLSKTKGYFLGGSGVEDWRDFSEFFADVPLYEMQSLTGKVTCRFSDIRLAPRTILVNGVEVPAPETAYPEDGIDFYVPDLAEADLFSKGNWDEAEWDLNALDRGLVYLDKESAIARAKAMLITQEVK